jgi:hypothetical protein
MAVIRKKTWPDYFEKVISGHKDFDFRPADFDIEEGDTLILEEWDPKSGKYTGRSCEKKVGGVWKLDLDEFGNKKVVEENGFYIIRF